MTRIGTVIAWHSADPNMPCFKLVVENGRVVLGCWRCIGYKGESKSGPQAIFIRVS